jgi:serine/threonine protein kinase
VKAIGRGSSGIVFQIVHRQSNKILVWKEIYVTEDNREKIINETKICLKMESPFIAPLLDSFEEIEERIFYLVEEFYEDGTLFTYFTELVKSGESIPRGVSPFFVFFCCCYFIAVSHLICLFLVILY